MKKRVIYLLMAAIGTVGFTGCGPGQDTTQDRTGTYDSPTGTEMGTENRTTTGNTTGTTTGNTTGTTTGNTTGTTTGNTTGTTGNQTATTGTSGTRTTTTTGTAGTTTGNTGQRSADATTQTGYDNRNNFELNEAADYSYNNENYRFTPDARGINITRDQNGTQSPFGTMRSFGDDGYYMVTTTNASGEEEITVGRFDERGNFTIYKYDRDGDRVTEQNYRSNTPMNQNNR